MIETVNTTYGILTAGRVTQESPWYRGYVLNHQQNNIQSSLIKELWKNKDEDSIGCGTEAIIRLLRCSEYWPVYILNYDPINTYDTQLSKNLSTVVSGISWSELVNWSNLSAIPANKNYSAKSSTVEKVVSSLFSVLVMC